jgi:DNA-binding NtrC family response regulator
MRERAEDRYTAVIIDLAFEKRGFDEAGFRILEEAIKDPFIEPILFTGTGSEEKVIRAMDLCAFKYIVKNRRKPDQSARTARQDDTIPDISGQDDMIPDISEQVETIPDISQVVRAVEYASKRRSALLKLEKIPPDTPMSHQEVLELRQCLLQLRRPKLTVTERFKTGQ